MSFREDAVMKERNMPGLTYGLICLLLILPCVLWQAECRADSLDASIGSYKNSRYGYAVNWLAGPEVTENKDGTGILVCDRQNGMELSVRGSLGKGRFGQGIENGIRELCLLFTSLPKKEVHEDEGWFLLSGKAGQTILTIKGYVAHDRVCLLELRYPEKHAAIFEDQFAPGVIRSFRLTRK